MNGSWGRRRDPEVTKRVLTSLAALIAVGAVVAGVVAFWPSSTPVAAPPPVEAPAEVEPEVPASPKPLTMVERVGVDTLLARFFGLSTRRVGSIAGEGDTRLGVDVSMSGDRHEGVGTLRSGKISGQAYLVDGKTYLRGTPEFWSALGVPDGPDGSWVLVPPEFLGDRVFLPSEVVVGRFADPSATLDGDTVHVGADSVVLDQGLGLSHITLAGYDVTVSPVGPDPLTLPDSDAPKAAVHTLNSEEGKWKAVAPPAPEPVTQRWRPPPPPAEPPPPPPPPQWCITPDICLPVPPPG